MGFLSNIGKAIKAEVTDFTAALKRGMPTSIGQLGTDILTVTGIAAVGTGVLAAASKLPVVSSVITAAKTLIPTTVKGKAIAAVAVPVVAGAVIREPTKAITTAVKAPGQLAQFGGDIASFAAEPSLSSAKQIITESPILSAATAVIGVGAAGAALAPTISSYLTREELEKQTSAFERTAEAAEAQLGQRTIGVIDKSGGFQTLEGVSIAPTTPTLPQTAAVTGTTSKKRRKSAKKAIMPNISQRVNVIVSNKSNSIGMKNYIKREILAV